MLKFLFLINILSAHDLIYPFIPGIWEINLKKELMICPEKIYKKHELINLTNCTLKIHSEKNKITELTDIKTNSSIKLFWLEDSLYIKYKKLIKNN